MRAGTTRVSFTTVSVSGGRWSGGRGRRRASPLRSRASRRAAAIRRAAPRDAVRSAPAAGDSRARVRPSVRRRRYRRLMERITLPADVTAALERARLQVEALAQTADELQAVLPDAVGT